eukprot:TRINITY_DN94040_c0_g1_i1.p1 TRINITY_DN94040_c0_g1~~TRINITY_DN94040_c0_g1_i1.p1  ORF type:complete len:371 (+),score=79.86 TRINITY_DN94040_c0_g1_i1:61-1173(+)
MGGQCWEVVGGGDKGGILVRQGQGTSSEQFPERLSTGSLVEELELCGERLRYKKLEGAGPESGWVSVSLKDKPLLVHAREQAKQTASAESVPSAPSQELRDGSYYVTLGVLFKKAGTDPESQKIIKLSRKVGSLVQTTNKVWRGPTGGYWVELDVSAGDSGAGEKPGYVMIDANGFGTPGPCLQKATKEDGPPLVLRAARPEGIKAWDGSELDKEFVVFRKTSISDMQIIIAMLFGLEAAGVSVQGKSGSPLKNTSSVEEAGFQGGDVVRFEHLSGKPMTLRVMSPLEAGVKLADLAIKDTWTVRQVKALLCSTTGLKKESTMMAKGKMGERVSEDARLEESHLVVDCGYKDGDEIGFIYLGDVETDLRR